MLQLSRGVHSKLSRMPLSITISNKSTWTRFSSNLLIILGHCTFSVSLLVPELWKGNIKSFLRLIVSYGSCCAEKQPCKNYLCEAVSAMLLRTYRRRRSMIDEPFRVMRENGSAPLQLMALQRGHEIFQFTYIDRAVHETYLVRLGH